MDPAAVEAFESKVLRKPEAFFTPSETVASDIKQFTKHVFDHCTKFVSQTSVTPLDQLYIDGFDADQIWEQLQLQNGPLLGELAKRIRGFNKQPDAVRLFPVEKSSDDAEEQEDEEGDGNNDSEQEDDDDDADNNSDDDEDAATASSSDSESESDDAAGAVKKAAKATAKQQQPATASKKTNKQQSKSKKTRDVAEDGFFDWDEMDRAAEEEEDDGESDIDLNADMDDDDDDDLDDEGDDDDEDDEDDDMEEASDDDDAKDMKYDDFFDGPDAEGDDDEDDDDEDDDEDAKLDADADDDDDDEFPMMNRAPYTDGDEAGDEDDLAERGILSSHQRQQLRLKKEITALEQEALGDKPWVLKGEVKSSARPENSLLEAVLDYDRPGKVAPVITVEVSVALEEMIKKRIVDDDFDDVVRKFASNEQDAKRKLEDVSMEKSKQGLGEIYEQEYMKTAMGFELDDDAKQEQSEIDVLFKSLCWKLDALSNYQFTPKPMVKELHVKPSVPAIAMEEVVPLSVSDANLKAPEEIYEKKRKRGEAVLQSKDEMTQDERKALRNAKKHARRKENRQKEADERLVAKLNPGLGNKYAKKKLMESIAGAKNVTTGKAIEGSTKQFSNSKEFFTRLQEQVQSSIKKKRSDAADAE